MRCKATYSCGNFGSNYCYVGSCSLMVGTLRNGSFPLQRHAIQSNVFLWQFWLKLLLRRFVIVSGQDFAKRQLSFAATCDARQRILVKEVLGCRALSLKHCMTWRRGDLSWASKCRHIYSFAVHMILLGSDAQSYMAHM